MRTSTGADAVGTVSDDSVREATGRGWDEWLATLDAAGARDWDHQRIVAYLEREHGESCSSWWRQSVAVTYERARGKRAVGQTAGGFQVGVQRSVARPVTEVWALVTSRPDLWLGEGVRVVLEPGRHYEAAGTKGEIRVVKPGDRLRLTWQLDGWTAPATVQLTLLATGPGKTALHAHVERLPDAGARETARARWREALDRVAGAGNEGR